MEYVVGILVFAVVFRSLRRMTRRFEAFRAGFRSPETAGTAQKSRRKSRPLRASAGAGERVFLLEYADASGEISQRKITIQGIESCDDGEAQIGRIGSGPFRIAAHCHLRDARREFRTDRILAMSSVKTGEIIDDPHRYLRTRYTVLAGQQLAKGHGGADILALWPALAALVWIARADRELSERETDVALQYMAETEPKAYADFADEWTLRRQVDRLHPIKAQALTKMPRVGSFEYQLLESYASRMVEANGAADPAAMARKMQLFTR